MMNKLRKLIEYKITYNDGNVDHVGWSEAKRMVSNPPADVDLIKKVTRWWQDDGQLAREDTNVLFERQRELSLTDYDRLYTLNELRKMCRERGIHPSGDKKALISKLLSQETWDMDEIKSKIQALPPEQRKEILTKYPDLALE